jgi:hypothetical protein
MNSVSQEIPDACDIEIIERTTDTDRDGAHGIVVPNEIRINGKRVLTPQAHPPIIHEITTEGHQPVMVTITLFARTVSVSHETATETHLTT